MWQYKVEQGLEQAIWYGGASIALRPHFHKDVQITIVTAGIRRFRTRLGIVEAVAGHTVILPACFPHEPLESAGCSGSSLNFYVQPDRIPEAKDSQPVIILTPPSVRYRSTRPDILLHDLALLVGQTNDGRARRSCRESAMIEAVLELPANLGDIAKAFSLSREGFIRSFTRKTGMTPHVYRLAGRLNEARHLLRDGLAPAKAAADAGFADQSHLGRLFRATFSATPAGYRKAMRA